MIIVKNYDKSIVGVIDKFPMFGATLNHPTKVLKLMSHKYTEDMEFESFEAFERYMETVKDGEDNG